MSALFRINLARILADKLRLDACSIERPTETADGSGGVQLNYAVIASNVKVSFAAVRQTDRERVNASQIQAPVQYRFGLPSGQDVTARDRINVGSRKFEVNSVEKAGALETGRQVICTEI